MRIKQIRALLIASIILSTDAIGRDDQLQRGFSEVVRPFLTRHCLECHNEEEPEAKLDLSGFSSARDVAKGFATWNHVLERLDAGEMPPEDASTQPTAKARRAVIQWSKAQRDFEAERNAGDPGQVLARRLSAAEYNYTIRDLTGVDIQPARRFPVDPASEAGFDNSGESLAMTPGLLAKYLDAARMVSDHLVLTPRGIAFASHPVVTETDRDKYCVRRIIDFYQKQNTEFADYFYAAWRLRQRGLRDDPAAALADVAAQERVSPKYLSKVWSLLEGKEHHFGPIAKLRSTWLAIGSADTDMEQVRTRCDAVSDYVRRLRAKLGHEFPHLMAQGINNGTQSFVLWRNRQYATHRMTLNPGALHVTSNVPGNKVTDTESEEKESRQTEERKAARDAQAAKHEIELNELADELKVLVGKGEITEYQAQKKFEAVKKEKVEELAKYELEDKSGMDSELVLPAAQSLQAQHLDAFKIFCAIFPDKFYVSRRGRQYINLSDVQLEDEGEVRLLSAGFHNQMGYFRDDVPLYELILDEHQQRELDTLWQQLDFIAAAPIRQHQGYIWFERAEGGFLASAEFDFARSEDKAATSKEKIKQLASTYLAKAKRIGASEEALDAISEHFRIIDASIRQVEWSKQDAQPRHLRALEQLAERAYRRPLEDAERSEVHEFYDLLRSRDALGHEDAVRDVLVRILTSPHFCFSTQPSDAEEPIHPLSDYALASRLSYFLCSSMPDEDLLGSAARDELHQPDILLSQVRRLLRDERVTGLATEFGGHWLGYRQFQQHNSVDRQRFPAFDDNLRQAMFEEPIRFFVDLIQRDGSVLDFLYGDHTLVNTTLAAHYGMEDMSLDPGQWVRVEQASRYERGGLLPMSVFLTKNAPGLRTSPVKRGYWVVRQLLGERIPPPPPEVPELPSDESKLGELTLREVLAKHRQHKNCAGCHDRFDSIGVALEGFGPIGERRSVDLGGRPVEIAATFPDGGARAGVSGLRDYLRDKRQEEFIDNTCRKLLSYALGRTLIVSDDKLLRQLRDQLVEDDYRFTSLIENIVTSSQFLRQRGRNYRYQD